MTKEDLKPERRRGKTSKSTNRKYDNERPSERAHRQNSKQSDKESIRKVNKGTSPIKSPRQGASAPLENCSPKDQDKPPETKSKQRPSTRNQNLFVENVTGHIPKDTTLNRNLSEKTSLIAPAGLAENEIKVGTKEQSASQYLAAPVPRVSHGTLHNKLQRESLIDAKIGTVETSDSMHLSKSEIAKSHDSPSSEAKSPIFSYNPSYYLSGAAAAGVMATVGTVIYIWSYLRRNKETVDDEKGGRKIKKRNRLHAREWRRDASTGQYLKTRVLTR
jgi:hypothetical protein